VREAHLPHSVVQCSCTAVMEVRRRGGDIPQARNANEFRLRSAQRAKNTMTLKKIAADIHALVTRNAAERFDKLETGEVGGTQGTRLGGKPTIETAARGKERALVGCDRIQKGGYIRCASVRITESLNHRRVSADFDNRFFRA